MATATRRLTPRKTPVQARAVDTRERILDAAAHVFSRHGYTAGTTNRIASEAGISIGSLYQYFPNKDAILVELVRQHIERGMHAIEQQYDGPRGEPRDLDRLLEAVIDAVIANHLDDPALHQVLFEESPRPPELLAELRALEDAIVDRTAAMLAADPSVTVPDPATAARLVVITIESTVHRTIATRDRPIEIERFRRELLTMIRRYLHQ